MKLEDFTSIHPSPETMMMTQTQEWGAIIVVRIYAYDDLTKNKRIRLGELEIIQN